MNEDEVIRQIKSALAIWNGMAVVLRRTLVVLGSIAIICSLSVTALTGSSWINENVVRLLSLMAALSLTASTAFGISAKGNNARNAWRHLNNSLLLYYAGKLTLEELIKSKDEGENLLGGVDFDGGVLK